MSEDRPARIDYGGRLFGTSDMNVAAPAIEGLPDEQHTSPVRRTFLLLIFFEFVLSWALWLVYVRTLGNFTEQIKDQVVNMRFNTSLFDVQIIGTSRFFFLEVAYGAYMTSYRWPAAVSTAVTTAYMIAKCIMFVFSSQHDNIGLCYAELILPIVMVWLFTLFLECRVLPQERMAKRIVNSYQRMNPDYLSAIEVQSAHFASIRHWATRAATSRGVGSIYESPEGSLINDVESLLSVSKYNSGGTNDAPVDVAALLTRAEDLRRSAWDVFEDVAWNEVSSSSLIKSGYFITSANLHGFSQRVFRLDAILHARVKTIFNDLVHGIEFSPLWNSTVCSARCLQKFPHEDLDIVHLVTKEVLGGLIKSRDFVVLRAWGVKDDISYVASSSVTFPKCPPSDECVRAEQLINAMFLQPTGSVCHLVCITCCDLKGWFSSQVVARGIQVSLNSLYQALQKRAISLSAGVEDFDEPLVPRPSPLPPRQRPILDEAC
ncbi:StAR-related lipid transfer protein 3 [Echinococcus granulosus]|nr:StAR-related lipid transfer protein 3 [Echinococcus granulosus]